MMLDAPSLENFNQTSSCHRASAQQFPRLSILLYNNNETRFDVKPYERNDYELNDNIPD